MAIITVARGTFSGAQSLAQCVAEKLGYRCISREVLVDAAKQYGVLQEMLQIALIEKPVILERMTKPRLTARGLRTRSTRNVMTESTAYTDVAKRKCVSCKYWVKSSRAHGDCNQERRVRMISHSTHRSGDDKGRRHKVGRLFGVR